jgi:hypothetical protein
VQNAGWLALATPLVVVPEPDETGLRDLMELLADAGCHPIGWMDLSPPTRHQVMLKRRLLRLTSDTKHAASDPMGSLESPDAPRAVFSTPKHDAFVVVDIFRGVPFLRLRTLTTTGVLIETLAPSRSTMRKTRHTMRSGSTTPRVSRERLFLAETGFSSPGRIVQVLDLDAGVPEIIEAHTTRVRARGQGAGTPISHDSAATMSEIWFAALRHRWVVTGHRLTAAKTIRRLVLVAALVAAFLVAGITAVALRDWQAGLTAGLVGGLLLGAAGHLLTPRFTRTLTSLPRLRPAFEMPEETYARVPSAPRRAFRFHSAAS